jgi:predicted MFS family arabinose efflux permease
MATKPSFNGYQKFVIALLAFLQFTIILDFMMMAPLGAILMPALTITTTQFGWVVSAYAFSAGASGLLAAGFADRFDRKKFLLFFYTGFVLSTLFCGLAPTYHFLLAARMLTGIFGGVIGSIVLAITTDLFTFDQRGRVMGFVQTAFAASQILGLPAGLYFANLWGWHAPFLMVVGISAGVGVIIWFKLKPIDGHLKLHLDNSPLHHLRTTITIPKHILALSTTAFLSLGGFMLMPFSSAFFVHNLGVSFQQLPLAYLISGICTIFVGPLVGKASDYFGKFKVFCFGVAVTIVMVIIYTHLGTTPFPLVVLVNVILFAGIFSRMIPSQALMSAIPAPENRGSFMSVNASLQQMSGGLASVIAGMIVYQAADGKIVNFDVLGYILVGTALITTVQMYFGSSAKVVGSLEAF